MNCCRFRGRWHNAPLRAPHCSARCRCKSSCRTRRSGTSAEITSKWTRKIQSGSIHSAGRRTVAGSLQSRLKLPRFHQSIARISADQCTDSAGMVKVKKLSGMGGAGGVHHIHPLRQHAAVGLGILVRREAQGTGWKGAAVGNVPIRGLGNPDPLRANLYRRLGSTCSPVLTCRRPPNLRLPPYRRAIPRFPPKAFVVVPAKRNPVPEYSTALRDDETRFAATMKKYPMSTAKQSISTRIGTTIAVSIRLDPLLSASERKLRFRTCGGRLEFRRYLNLSPQGETTIAQRGSAGWRARASRVPRGRQRSSRRLFSFRTIRLAGLKPDSVQQTTRLNAAP